MVHEKVMEYTELQQKAGLVTDPHFISLRKKLLSFLGFLSHEYCSCGGVVSSGWSQGSMDAISAALRIVEYEFTEGIEIEVPQSLSESENNE